MHGIAGLRVKVSASAPLFGTAANVTRGSALHLLQNSLLEV